ncbi:hypothetical protein QWZ13_17745 [Reinekea marina]|uniref:hypothetical protein n=1 Tax=Reinekea marina TaxID=1310421 RepID=UPI0025B3ABB7|nr:hypothetical protein [Reinekea marina]MDN3650753.1 hypothetical protein [Reinekea marina]
MHLELSNPRRSQVAPFKLVKALLREWLGIIITMFEKLGLCPIFQGLSIPA